MQNTAGADSERSFANPGTMSLFGTQKSTAVAGVTIIIALSSAIIHTLYIVFIFYLLKNKKMIML